MARIRTIKPEFWRHEDLCALPESTHMFAAAILNYADDFGYFNANPALIKGELYPLREPSVPIPESLRSLQSCNYLRLGIGPGGRQYGHVVHFTAHQRVSHPTESKIADLAIVWDNSWEIPENIQKPPEPLRPEGKGREQGKEVLPDKPGDNYSDDFLAFWKGYPTDPNMSKKDAYAQWRKLSPAKRQAAFEALPGFKRYCEQNKAWYRTIYADRFLKQEKFEGYAADHAMSPEEIEAAKDRADRLLRRGKYDPQFGGVVQ